MKNNSKWMRRIAIVVFIALATISMARAENNSFYGYGSVSVPIVKADSTYVLDYACVGMFGVLLNKNHQYNHYTYKFEVDVNSQALKYAQITMKRPTRYFDWSLTAGKYLAPVSYLYNGPKTQRHVKWEETFTDYSVRNVGLFFDLSLNKYPIVFRLANGDQKVWSASVDNRFLKLFWEDHIGSGLIISSGGLAGDIIGTWSYGYSHYTNDDHSFFFKFELPYNRLLLIGLVDFYDRPKREQYVDQRFFANLSYSLSYQYTKNSFIKCGWHEQSIYNEWLEKWSVLHTWSMQIMFSTDSWN
ncbi:MAG: hypothetical protein ABH884_03965 [Candidatus Komeilibacteria bacterium]